MTLIADILVYIFSYRFMDRLNFDLLSMTYYRDMFTFCGHYWMP